MGRLTEIVMRPKGAPCSETGYTRVPLSEAQLVEGYGIQGDAKGGAEMRNLNIMSAETLQRLATEGFVTEPGRMGEQLAVSGVDIDALPAGARLQIGDAACIEITKPRTGCSKLERYQGKPLRASSGRLGMMARVIRGGRIAVGDNVVLLPSSTESSS